MHVERPTILVFSLFLNLALFTFVSHAQPTRAQPATDTTVPMQPATPATSYTRTRLGADSRLYNGREYIRNGTPAKGSPYFQWDSLRPGSLDYDGITYDIPMEYDLAQDQLVIRNYADNILIGLVSERATRFSIGSFLFRYIGPGTDHLPEPGFYQELFAGSRVTLLARRRKDLVFPSTPDQLAQYVRIDAFFLLLDSTSYRINSEKELLEILADKKSDLKKYIRKDHLSFRRQHLEGSLIRAVAYYQQIKS